jgi:hypothetical protein
LHDGKRDQTVHAKCGQEDRQHAKRRRSRRADSCRQDRDRHGLRHRFDFNCDFRREPLHLAHDDSGCRRRIGGACV